MIMQLILQVFVHIVWGGIRTYIFLCFIISSSFYHRCTHVHSLLFCSSPHCSTYTSRIRVKRVLVFLFFLFFYPFFFLSSRCIIVRPVRVNIWNAISWNNRTWQIFYILLWVFKLLSLLLFVFIYKIISNNGSFRMQHK